MRKTALVFPGRRPGLHLLRELETRIGKPFFPPDIFSIDDFIFSIYSENNRGERFAGDGPELEYHLYNAIVKTACDGRFGEHLIEITRTMENFAPWGRKILSAIDEIMVELVEPENVERISGYEEEIVEWVKDFWKNITGIIEAFHHTLKQKGLFYRGMAYKWVAENIESLNIPFKHIYLCGFSALSRSEQRIFRHILENGGTLILHSDVEKWEGKRSSPYYFHFLLHKKWGFEPVVLEGKKERDRDIKIYSASNIHAEVAGAGEVITSDADMDTCVVLPDPEPLIPFLHTVGVNLSGKFNITMGYPFERTPFYSLFETLNRVHITGEGDNLYLPDYISLISHPYVKSIVMDGRTMKETCIKLKNLINRRSSDTGAVFLPCNEIEELLEERDEREIVRKFHEQFIHRLREKRKVSDWAEEFLNIITLIGKSLEAHPHPLTNTYLYALMDRLSQLIETEAGNIEFSSYRGLIGYIKSQLSSITIPFIGEPLSGIQVMGMLETRCLNFRRVIILNVNEGTIPGAYKYDPLLPTPLRRLLRLPDHRDMEAIYSYNFFRLIEGADEVHLFYLGGSMDTGEKNIKSRFIERIEWEMEKSGKPVNEEKLAFMGILKPEYRTIEKNSDMIERLLSTPFTHTMLQDYLLCPIVFYLKHIVGLREETEVSEEVEGKDIGIFLHDLMYRIYKPFTGEKPAIDIDEAMETFYREFNNRFINIPRGKRDMLKRVVENRLRNFLMGEKGDSVIYGLEREYEGEIKPGEKSYKFRGRIDRIDYNQDRFSLIDYKTGSLKIPNKKIGGLNNMEDVRKKIKTLQPIIYINLFSEAEGIPMEKIGFHYYSLLTSERREVETPITEMKQALTMVLEEIINTEIPFEPYPESGLCYRCKYKVFCGKS